MRQHWDDPSPLLDLYFRDIIIWDSLVAICQLITKILQADVKRVKEVLNLENCLLFNLPEIISGDW